MIGLLNWLLNKSIINQKLWSTGSTAHNGR